MAVTLRPGSRGCASASDLTSSAAQACLLVVGRNTHVYDRLRSVLVYPSQIVVPGEWHGEDGVVTDEPPPANGAIQDGGSYTDRRDSKCVFAQ